MTERVLGLPEVMALTSLGKSAIYAGIAACTFPKPIKLTVRRVGWLETEIREWVAARVAEREAA